MPAGPPLPISRAAAPGTAARALAGRTARTVLTALAQLGSGLGLAFLALGMLVWLVLVAVASAVWIGRPLVPGALRGLRALADRERVRLGRRGAEVLSPGPALRDPLAAVRSPAVRRELLWLAGAATLGLLVDLVGVLLPVYAVRDLTFPLWRWLLPGGEDAAPWWWSVEDWSGVVAVSVLGLGWLALTVGGAPVAARLQARVSAALLAPPPGTDLSMRVVQLTASRAAALDAHTAELRRIERALHDGTQNRLVAVTVLLGAARRSLAAHPETAEELLERAQLAAEEALGELRAVARGILPPVLVDRGLAGALAGLAAGSPVPCALEVDVPGRCPASVEATAWFVVAEALTNTAKHSGATAVTVTVRQRDGRLLVRVADDGRGGADERDGSGLAGMRQRVAAHDGELVLTSPAGGPTVLEVDLPCGS